MLFSVALTNKKSVDFQKSKNAARPYMVFCNANKHIRIYYKLTIIILTIHQLYWFYVKQQEETTLNSNNNFSFIPLARYAKNKSRVFSETIVGETVAETPYEDQEAPAAQGSCVFYGITVLIRLM